MTKPAAVPLAATSLARRILEWDRKHPGFPSSSIEVSIEEWAEWLALATKLQARGGK